MLNVMFVKVKDLEMIHCKLNLRKKSGFGPRAAKGNDDQSKELAKSRYEMGQYKTDPTKRIEFFGN